MTDFRDEPNSCFNCKFWKNVMCEKCILPIGEDRCKEFKKLCNNELYCASCDDFVPYVIRHENVDLTVIDTHIQNIPQKTPLCIRCGRELFSGDIEDENLLKAYKMYKEITGKDIPRNKKKWTLYRK